MDFVWIRTRCITLGFDEPRLRRSPWPAPRRPADRRPPTHQNAADPGRAGAVRGFLRQRRLQHLLRAGRYSRLCVGAHPAGTHPRRLHLRHHRAQLRRGHRGDPPCRRQLELCAQGVQRPDRFHRRLGAAAQLHGDRIDLVVLRDQLPRCVRKVRAAVPAFQDQRCVARGRDDRDDRLPHRDQRDRHPGVERAEPRARPCGSCHAVCPGNPRHLLSAPDQRCSQQHPLGYSADLGQLPREHLDRDGHIYGD